MPTMANVGFFRGVSIRLLLLFVPQAAAELSAPRSSFTTVTSAAAATASATPRPLAPSAGFLPGSTSHRHRRRSVVMASRAASSTSDLRVAIIGAGAAGLATARQFTRRGVRPRVFEKDAGDDDVKVGNVVGGGGGGVWKHVPNDRTRPMYRGLRTNLPREVMAYRERPWGVGTRGGGGERSYVTHGEVLEYLRGYASDFGLNELVSYGCEVTRLIVQDRDNEDDGTGSASNGSCGGGEDPSTWPKIALRWEETKENGQCFEEVFDAVCVCNGHYAVPSPPAIPGLSDRFAGRVMHSIEYDDPAEFEGLTVLCVGARASGSDLAREISEYARMVYVSDPDCPSLEERDGMPFEFGRNVLRVPRTEFVDAKSAIHFGGGCAVSPADVDVVVLCSGYDYSFPFVDEKESNLELGCVPGERRVTPLYEQLWHASAPSVAFVGLPHSVVPFPLFEMQAGAVAAQLCGTAPVSLPSEKQRREAAREDAERGGPKGEGRVQDTHYLGDAQWDYLRTMAKLAGEYDEGTENFIATNKAIYNHSGSERKGLPPGVSDQYRMTCYQRDEANRSFKILASEVSKADTEAVR